MIIFFKSKSSSASHFFDEVLIAKISLYREISCLTSIGFNNFEKFSQSSGPLVKNDFFD